MKKIFAVLVILSFVGAGALWWLMNSLPDPGKSVSDTAKEHTASHASAGQKEEESTDEEHAADEHAGEEHTETAADSADDTAHADEEAHGGGAAVAEKTASPKEPVKAEESPYKVERKNLFANYEDSKTKTETAVTAAAPVQEASPKKVAKAPAAQTARPKARLQASKYYVQVKALADKGTATRDEARVLASTWTESTDGQPSAICPVDLLDRGQWVRVLLGPYRSYEEAEQVLGKASTITTDKPFIAGDMECRL